MQDLTDRSVSLIEQAITARHLDMERAVNPSEGRSAKERVIASAEKHFAAYGFSGASMKAIATDAGVAQGLLHYHFENKSGLYREVIARRSAVINAARFKLLEKVDTGAANAVERVFEAFLAPPFDTGSVDSGYPQMLARLVVGDDVDQDLVQEHYDACAARFIDTLQIVLPDVSRRDLTHSYIAAIGTMITAFSRVERAARLAGEDSRQLETPEQTVAGLATFCAAGARAFQNATKTQF